MALSLKRSREFLDCQYHRVRAARSYSTKKHNTDLAEGSARVTALRLKLSQKHWRRIEVQITLF